MFNRNGLAFTPGRLPAAAVAAGLAALLAFAVAGRFSRFSRKGCVTIGRDCVYFPSLGLN